MEFAGRITAIDTKHDEENSAEGTLVEVTDFTKDSTVEISFNDRNERCYLRFRLSDFMLALAEQFGTKAG